MSDIENDSPMEIRQVMDRYERSLVLYARRLVGDAERARDVVQETFLCLCRETPKGLNGSLAPWLYAVCRSKAMDVRRKEKRMQLITDDATDAMENPVGDPAEDAERADDLSHVLLLLAGLPANQQEVLRLKFQSGLNYREISHVTGLSESNVGFLIHTGLKTIRAKMHGGEH